MLLSITGILMAICLLYNLARWYLIIQYMKGEHSMTTNFRKTIKTLTIILSIVGVLQVMTIVFIEEI